LDMALPLRNIPRTGHFEFDAGPHFLKGWNQNPFQVEETGGKILEEAADQRKARRAFGEQGEGKKGIRKHGGGTGRPDIPMIAAAFESKTGLIKNFLGVDPGPLQSSAGKSAAGLDCLEMLGSQSWFVSASSDVE